ncbi:CAP domain-containing protein [Alteromonas ponticola]|uniref:CAP domain-containing protein n=1 Tax=Alteromonas aquimaris TaxID=2998417 RepID=A0ABT3P7Z7_9ALTE|nr:CAP domain-containing protein [Alteromonas aquimaris]MCW8108211.1 CAP domain-containing protein [Alteromonas aquimaris]
MKYLQHIAAFIIVVSVNSVASDFSECGNSQEARELVRLIANDENQLRSTIQCNSVLMEVALDKVEIMANHGLVMHNLGGSPNQRLRSAGFELPKYYGTFMANQVEAVAGGYSNAEKVWRAFKNSEHHRKHLLGEHPVYLKQDKIGVAFIRKHDSPHVEYWAVYLTEGSGNDAEHFEDVPNKGIDMLTPVSENEDK